jgi:hypothetical protein
MAATAIATATPAEIPAICSLPITELKKQPVLSPLQVPQKSNNEVMFCKIQMGVGPVPLQEMGKLHSVVGVQVTGRCTHPTDSIQKSSVLQKKKEEIRKKADLN